MVTKYYPNKNVKIIDELNICGCGNPELCYKLVHTILKEINSSGVNTDDKNLDYYLFVLYQLNSMGFLDHGSSVFGSWITKKGMLLFEALNEMEKSDYDYQDFFNSNLTTESVYNLESK